jgi:hypothetical protein
MGFVGQQRGSTFIGWLIFRKLLSNSYWLKCNRVFHGNKTVTARIAKTSHVLTHKCQMKFSKDLVLVMNSIGVATRGRWVKCEKVGGLESPSSSRVQTKKKFPFLMLGVIQQGLKPNQCSATLLPKIHLNVSQHCKKLLFIFIHS